ncbi:MAG: hypothetical protein JST26_09020 [Bacteroidetes bacterium]|nr:hypothetical protein [Bacteroidota bacterium]
MKASLIWILALNTGLCAYRANARMLVSLQKAMDKKMITAKATCAGGLALKYSINNLAKDSVCLMLPAGWRFNSNAGKNDYQDILVTRDQLLVLGPKSSITFDIKGYCCEADKSGPVKGVAYTTGKMADSNLVKLALYLNAHPTDENTEQYAVWAISNNKPTSNITNANDSLAAALREFVAGVKGEPLPWFTLLKRARVTSAGEIQEIPLKLKATLRYNLAQAEYSYFYVLDAGGHKVGQITGQWLIPGSEVAYPVNLALRGFQKGNYKLVLETKDNRLVEKDFEI